MKKLKECPFCGNQVSWCKDIAEYHKLGQNCHIINCENCGDFDLNKNGAKFPELYGVIADQFNNRTSIPISKIEELIEIMVNDDCTFAVKSLDLKKLIDEAKQ